MYWGGNQEAPSCKMSLDEIAAFELAYSEQDMTKCLFKQIQIPACCLTWIAVFAAMAKSTD